MATVSYELVFGIPAALSGAMLIVRFVLAWHASTIRDAVQRLRAGFDHALLVVFACTASVLLLHELLTDRVCHGHC